MKIGTKSNAIDDLGKFDGSKMTIKVNGKQIYPQKRYAIVRVDNNCPFMQEKLDFSSCSKMFNCDKFIRCENCEHNCQYGDTKEQLIRKIVQVLRRLIKGKDKQHSYRAEYLVEQILEFLGVEK